MATHELIADALSKLAAMPAGDLYIDQGETPTDPLVASVDGLADAQFFVEAPQIVRALAEACAEQEQVIAAATETRDAMATALQGIVSAFDAVVVAVKAARERLDAQ